RALPCPSVRSVRTGNALGPRGEHASVGPAGGQGRGADGKERQGRRRTPGIRAQRRGHKASRRLTRSLGTHPKDPRESERRPE
ncbi:hypothetical protein IscW_ISCW003003, partial [Ixodes scapularis]